MSAFSRGASSPDLSSPLSGFVGICWIKSALGSKNTQNGEVASAEKAPRPAGSSASASASPLDETVGAKMCELRGQTAGELWTSP